MYSDMWATYVVSRVLESTTPAGRDSGAIQTGIMFFVLLVSGQMLSKQSRLYWLGHL